MIRPVPPSPAAVMCVGRATALAPSRVAWGTPRTKHDLSEVFVSVSAYSIWPAPALPGTRAKFPARSAPVHGSTAVGNFDVTVSVVVTVCVWLTVTVLVPPPEPHPAALSATAASATPARARRPATPGRRRAATVP